MLSPTAQGRLIRPVIRAADSSVALAPAKSLVVSSAVMAGSTEVVMGTIKAQGILNTVKHIS